MKKSNRAFVIQFAGLKNGKHVYDFDIDRTFFEQFEHPLIEDGQVHVQLTLEKKETMMIGEFLLGGTVSALCDRCNDPLELPVNAAYRIIWKFGNEVSDDENLIVLDPEAYELDVAPQIYEFLIVSLPGRILHEPGDCNPEMMALYDTYTINAGATDDEDDEDWDEDDDLWDDEDDDFDPDDDDDNDDDPDDDRPIDPRWSALKNLN